MCCHCSKNVCCLCRTNPGENGKLFHLTASKSAKVIKTLTEKYGWLPKKTIFVCLRHYTPDQYKTLKNGTIILLGKTREEVVPTRIPPTESDAVAEEAPSNSVVTPTEPHVEVSLDRFIHI